MSMNPCNKCLENYWDFKNIDGYVIATCKNCGNEAEFKSKDKEKMFEGKPCRKCKTPVLLKESRFKESKLKKPYYYTHYYRCPKCKTFYMSERYKIFKK